jgi:hypothetical protein
MRLVCDMRGADLTSADKDGVRLEHLEGVLWSTSTRWPPGWPDWLKDNSREPKPRRGVGGPASCRVRRRPGSRPDGQSLGLPGRRAT